MVYVYVAKTLLISLISGIILTVGILVLTRKYNFGMDTPGPLRIHLKAIPRLGGLALYGAFMIGGVFTLLPPDLLNRQILGVAVTGTLALSLGVLDDLLNLTPRVKFVGQLFVAMLAIFGFEILIPYINNPLGGRFEFGYGLSVLISIVWLVGITNVTNLLDGIDGLATGVMAIFSIILLIVALQFKQRELSILAATLLGSTLAFLVFNFTPAKIFMGDSGSFFLGIIAGELSILAGAKLATALLVLAIPIADVAYTLYRRYKNRVSLTKRDTAHFHHRLILMGLSQGKVCLVYYIVAGLFGLVTLIPITALKVAAMLVAFSVYIGVLIFVNRRIASNDQFKE